MTTPATDMATARLGAVRAWEEALRAGATEAAAALAAGASAPTLRRWRRAFRAGGAEALRDGRRGRSGRRSAVEPTPEETACLRGLYIKANWREGLGSAPGAARMAAADTATCLRPETRAAILKPRADKCAIPAAIRRACMAADATVREYRDPDALRLGGIHAAGLLRMERDPDGSLRMLRPGEEQCWDDGSVNFLCCAPWPRGGDKVSERYGVRVGRFQLLAGIDCRTDFCPGWTYVLRAMGSYRAEDACAALAGAWAHSYVPERAVLEGGVWQAGRTLEFVRLAGAELVSAKGRPRAKLIEGWWSRLWQALATRTGGQIGRYRGEMGREADIWQRCRTGSEDPRRYFPTLQQALEAMEWSVAFVNRDRVVSRTYGCAWVPAEAHAEGLAAAPRPPLPAGLGHYALRERVRRRVRRDGLVGAMAPSPLGFPHAYLFASEDLLAVEGAEVWVHFDPWASPLRAVCTLAEAFRGRPAGTVVAAAAACINAAPELLREAGAWRLGWSDAAAASRIARARAQAYVRREQRSGGLDGSRVIRASEDNAGSTLGIGAAPALAVAAAPEPDPLGTADVDFGELEREAGVVLAAG
jgi:transposase-like protein